MVFPQTITLKLEFLINANKPREVDEMICC